MISRIVSIFMFVLTLSSAIAQGEVKWTFYYDNQLSTVFFKAELYNNYHLYSQYLDENLGPIPTTFEFIDNEFVGRVGAVKENNVKTVFDENFGGNVEIIEEKAIFSQEITLSRPTTLKGSILYMLCDDKGCLPPDVVEFEIKMN